jgi:hypothetical protein
MEARIGEYRAYLLGKVNRRRRRSSGKAEGGQQTRHLHLLNILNYG